MKLPTGIKQGESSKEFMDPGFGLAYTVTGMRYDVPSPWECGFEISPVV